VTIASTDCVFFAVTVAGWLFAYIPQLHMLIACYGNCLNMTLKTGTFRSCHFCMVTPSLLLLHGLLYASSLASLQRLSCTR
jgi:hypothetical protein